MNEENVNYYGTFGKGVLVVPNEKMKFHELSSENNRFLNITSGTGNNLFLSQQGWASLIIMERGKTR